jgi:hypothetical protein
VTYSALASWQTTRRARVDSLVELYGIARGLAADSHVEQVFFALVLRLAAEFQGFVRDLHDEAVADVVRRSGSSCRVAGLLFMRSMTSKRDIDRLNASAATLTADFGRLGFAFWPELGARYRLSDDWRRNLDSLNVCRNAVAHDRSSVLADLARRGWGADLTSVRRWLNSLDELASAMDDIVGKTVDRVSGIAETGEE